MIDNEGLQTWLHTQDVNLNDLNSVIHNEVSAVINNSEKITAALTAYKNTAQYVEKLSKEYNFDYCCIKALRSYSHFNTDLNIAVKPDDFEKIINLLESLGWSRRSWWSQFKEDIAERGKRKLVCNTISGLSEIHLYPGLSWHGFEYTSPSDVLNNKTRYEFGNTEVFNTNNSLDLLSNIGHALFERYKFTAGEVFHVSSVIENSSVDDIATARIIAEKNGWGNGFVTIIEFITDLRRKSNVTYPILIDRRILWATWRERFLYQCRHNKHIVAVIELIFNWIWSGPVYNMYSKIKKFLVGKSGIEKKYGGIN